MEKTFLPKVFCRGLQCEVSSSIVTLPSCIYDVIIHQRRGQVKQQVILMVLLWQPCLCDFLTLFWTVRGGTASCYEHASFSFFSQSNSRTAIDQYCCIACDILIQKLKTVWFGLNLVLWSRKIEFKFIYYWKNTFDNEWELNFIQLNRKQSFIRHSLTMKTSSF